MFCLWLVRTVFFLGVIVFASFFFSLCNSAFHSARENGCMWFATTDRRVVALLFVHTWVKVKSV